MSNSEEQEIAWYPIRVTYSREEKIKLLLDERKIENFLPLCRVTDVKNGKVVKQLVPAIHNLIFVRSSQEVITDLKRESETLAAMRYIMDRESKSPIIVPESQMQNFITMSLTYDEGLVYLSSEEVNLRQGDRVLIIGGTFKGIEGELIRIKGDRRVVVRIEGFMAVATAFINPALLKKL